MDVCSSKTRCEVGILSASKPGKTSITTLITNTITFVVHCPVLDDPAPDDVIDGDGSRVGDLGDLEPLGVLEEGEELPIGDRIE